MPALLALHFKAGVAASLSRSENCGAAARGAQLAERLGNQLGPRHVVWSASPGGHETGQGRREESHRRYRTVRRDFTAPRASL